MLDFIPGIDQVQASKLGSPHAVAFTRVRIATIITAFSIVAGAIAGLLVAVVLDVAIGGTFKLSLDGELFAFGAIVGGILGTVLGPAAAFGFLRRVPIGRLFGQTIVGAAIGGLASLWLGEVFPGVGNGLFTIIGGGVVGFCVAGVRLWWRFRQSASPAG
jgi:hypothetical protein